MENKKKAVIRSIICLIAALALLTGCSFQGFYSQESGESRTEDSTESGRWGAKTPVQGSFDEFMEAMFLDNVNTSTMNLHFYLADPESYGITPGPVTLGGFGYEDREQSLESLRECRRQLRQFSRADLSREQRMDADILEAYLNICEKDLELDYYYEPFRIGNGLHASLPYTMAEYAFYDKGDVEDYLTLLTQVDTYFAQVLEWEEEKADQGLFMSDEMLDKILEECDVYLWDGQEDFFLQETFRERLEEVEDLTEAETSALLERHETILKNDFVDAYRQLKDGLEELRGRGKNELGITYFPKGDAYYEYLIESNIGMTYKSVDDLYDAVASDIMEIYEAMYSLMEKDESLWDRWGEEEEEQRGPGDMLEDLRLRILEDFPEGPDSTYEIKKVAKSMEEIINPAFYMIPPIDRYKENVIYINEGMISETYNLYAILAHEGYPGHLYQTVYFSGQNRANLRKIIDFAGYSEGWGTYAEYYSYRWMYGDDDGLQILNRLEAMLNMAICTMLDIGIHYYGWTKEDVVEVCGNVIGITSEEEIEDTYLYILSDPAGYLDYYAGYLEIRKLAEEAQEILGDEYEAKEFHRFLLDFGPAPFTVIRPYFEEWLAGYEFRETFPDIEYDPVLADRRA